MIKAKERGVSVKVVLDQNIDFLREADEDAVQGGKNERAFQILKRSGVPVFYDEAGTYTHAKAVIIDGETVILGSTNWSVAALTKNNEANVRIRSREFAAALSGEFGRIKLQTVSAPLIPTVRIPKDFLMREDLLGEMATQSDKRTFDVYLYLLKQYSEGG